MSAEHLMSNTDYESAHERLARIETLVAGVQNEVTVMREMLVRLVRIEEQHSNTREALERLHRRIDQNEDRLDVVEKNVISLRGPLLWLAGIAATVVAGLASVLIVRTL